MAPHPPLNILATALPLVLMLAVCWTALPTPAMGEELSQTIRELKKEIERLRSRVEELEQNQQPQAAPTPPAPRPLAKPPPPVTVGDIKGSFQIPGTNTSLALGGYVKLDVIYSNHGEATSSAGDQFLIPGAIPVEIDGEDDQLTLHGRESRLWVKTYTPTTVGPLETYLEIDFFAYQAPGDERVSNSFAPRLRHAYGRLGRFLAGQTWSTFQNVGALPELADFVGPVSTVFARQPQLRWTQPFTGGELHIGLENPETTLTNHEGNRITPGDDRLPDLAARASFSGDWGQASVATMVRELRSDGAVVEGTEDSSVGAAVSIAGRIKSYGRDNLHFLVTYGNVLGRYFSLNTFNGGTIDERGEIELTPLYGGFLAYQHWWSRGMRSTFAVSIAGADNDLDRVPPTVTERVHASHLNLLWSPVDRATFGLEYIYALRRLENDDEGELHRLQFTAIHHF